MNTNFFIGFSVVTARTHEGVRAGSGEAVVSQNNLSLVMIRGTGNKISNYSFDSMEHILKCSEFI